MIVCFECDKKTKDIIDFLTENGNYENSSNLIRIAIENLAVLHKSNTNNKIIVLENKERKIPKSNVNTFPVPSLFQNIFVEDNPSIKSNNNLNEDTLVAPVSEWIFAMYNRFLPAKLNCRAIGNLIQGRETLKFDYLYKQIAESIEWVSDYFSVLEKKHSLLKEDSLLTGLPKRDKDFQKSLQRYLYHFLGKVNREGVLEGMMTKFKFINYDSGKNPTVYLTRAGWNFAKLPNPLLDNFYSHTVSKFSPDEKSFLLNHIRAFVPKEFLAYKRIFELINNGSDTPSLIDHALASDFNKDKILSKSFLSSQRSGVISRMIELELLQRKKTNVFIKYFVTETGKKYLGESNE